MVDTKERFFISIEKDKKKTYFLVMIKMKKKNSQNLSNASTFNVT
jgi:hypothetical protein